MKRGKGFMSNLVGKKMLNSVRNYVGEVFDTGKGKGWRNESTRHSLAAQGVRTSSKHIAKAVGTSNMIARYAGNDAREIVEKVLLGNNELARKIPTHYDIEVIKLWRGGTFEVLTSDGAYVFNVDEDLFDNILERIDNLKLGRGR